MPSAPYSILIADDDAGCRSTLNSIFEQRGYETLLAENGEQALTLVEERNVHCLLLDMHMPDITGLEVLEVVRQRLVIVPCIVITGAADKQLMEKALSLHVYSVLSKPIQRELVSITVRRAIERAYPDA